MADYSDHDDFETKDNSRPKNLSDIEQDYFTSTDDPELEFDDDGTQLSSTKEAELEAELEEELNKEAGAFRGGAITPDGLIDEDFEKELGTPSEEETPSEFHDVERYGIIEVAGDDKFGRKVILISACKLPSSKAFDHQRLLLYIKHTLDKYVEQDYVLVYFHYGLHRYNKPKLTWLHQAYKEFDRKYKKNLKMLYIVHATNFIKVLWKLFRPLISVKFGQKVMQIDYLEDLRKHVPFEQLAIPLPVVDCSVTRNRRTAAASAAECSRCRDRNQCQTDTAGPDSSGVRVRDERPSLVAAKFGPLFRTNSARRGVDTSVIQRRLELERLRKDIRLRPANNKSRFALRSWDIWRERLDKRDNDNATSTRNAKDDSDSVVRRRLSSHGSYTLPSSLLHRSALSDSEDVVDSSMGRFLNSHRDSSCRCRCSRRERADSSSRSQSEVSSLHSETEECINDDDDDDDDDGHHGKESCWSSEKTDRLLLNGEEIKDEVCRERERGLFSSSIHPKLGQDAKDLVILEKSKESLISDFMTYLNSQEDDDDGDDNCCDDYNNNNNNNNRDIDAFCQSSNNQPACLEMRNASTLPSSKEDTESLCLQSSKYSSFQGHKNYFEVRSSKEDEIVCCRSSNSSTPTRHDVLSTAPSETYENCRDKNSNSLPLTHTEEALALAVPFSKVAENLGNQRSDSLPSSRTDSLELPLPSTPDEDPCYQGSSNSSTPTFVDSLDLSWKHDDNVGRQNSDSLLQSQSDSLEISSSSKKEFYQVSNSHPSSIVKVRDTPECSQTDEDDTDTCHQFSTSLPSPIRASLELVPSGEDNDDTGGTVLFHAHDPLFVSVENDAHNINNIIPNSDNNSPPSSGRDLLSSTLSDGGGMTQVLEWDDVVVVKPRLSSFGDDTRSSLSDLGSSKEMLDSTPSENGFGFGFVDFSSPDSWNKNVVESDDSDLGSSKDDLSSRCSCNDTLVDSFLLDCGLDARARSSVVDAASSVCRLRADSSNALEVEEKEEEEEEDSDFSNTNGRVSTNKCSRINVADIDTDCNEIITTESKLNLERDDGSSVQHACDDAIERPRDECSTKGFSHISDNEYRSNCDYGGDCQLQSLNALPTSIDNRQATSLDREDNCCSTHMSISLSHPPLEVDVSAIPISDTLEHVCVSGSKESLLGSIEPRSDKEHNTITDKEHNTISDIKEHISGAVDSTSHVLKPTPNINDEMSNKIKHKASNTTEPPVYNNLQSQPKLDFSPRYYQCNYEEDICSNGAPENGTKGNVIVDCKQLDILCSKDLKVNEDVCNSITTEDACQSPNVRNVNDEEDEDENDNVNRDARFCDVKQGSRALESPDVQDNANSCAAANTTTDTNTTDNRTLLDSPVSYRAQPKASSPINRKYFVYQDRDDDDDDDDEEDEDTSSVSQEVVTPAITLTSSSVSSSSSSSMDSLSPRKSGLAGTADRTRPRRSGVQLSNNTKSLAGGNCLKSVTSALRRLPTPSKYLSSHRSGYDLERAASTYLPPCPANTAEEGSAWQPQRQRQWRRGGEPSALPHLITFNSISDLADSSSSPVSMPPSPFSSLSSIISHAPLSPTPSFPPPPPCTPETAYPRTPPGTPTWSPLIRRTPLHLHLKDVHAPAQPTPTPHTHTSRPTSSSSSSSLLLPSNSSLSLSSASLSAAVAVQPVPPSSSSSSSSSLSLSFSMTLPFRGKRRSRSLSLDGRADSGVASSSSTLPRLSRKVLKYNNDGAYHVVAEGVDGGEDVVDGSKIRRGGYIINSVTSLPMLHEFDAKKVERSKQSSVSPGNKAKEEKKAQQFGLSLTEIRENTGRIIPRPIEDTIDFLKSSDGDETEGLFRRCARVSTMREVQERYDDGETVDFNQYGDPHLAGAILKKFLRELTEPLMTFELFEPITRLHYLEQSKQVGEVRRILKDELPEENYIILKHIFQFLKQVISKSEINLMTAANMATVFGPNIAWPKGQANLANVEQAVKFSLILLESFDDVFLW